MVAAVSNIHFEGEAIAFAVSFSIAERLRAEYPEVSVRPMNSLAAVGYGRVWYVYRDGHPVRSTSDGVGAGASLPL
jgi:hypothetical protein